jgi:hyaluronan synthase
MYSFVVSLDQLATAGSVSLFLVFWVYVWSVWVTKAGVSASYRPVAPARDERLRTTVIVPVYKEDPAVFEQVLDSVVGNRPTELIVVLDGGDARLEAIAEASGATVIAIPKGGKRMAIQAGLEISDPTTEIVLVVDSDTIWAPELLDHLLPAFDDPRVGGATPRQSIFGREDNSVRRLADWIEDLRYTLTVPAQSRFGQVGCLAGRTIAYRRGVFEEAVDALVSQSVLGVAMEIGDDRVLTNELLKRGWRTVYQSTARVYTDAPNEWGRFWKQQLRWARSSQRETLLSLGWLWRKPFALFCFLTDILTPFFLFAVLTVAIVHVFVGSGSWIGLAIWIELLLAYVGATISIGLRQLPHFRRFPRDAITLPLFVLQLTLVIVPTRIVGLATCFHQDWHTRT